MVKMEVESEPRRTPAEPKTADDTSTSSDLDWCRCSEWADLNILVLARLRRTGDP
jgi:hypothetical protein